MFIMFIGSIVGSMLVHRLRCWPNIEPTLDLSRGKVIEKEIRSQQEILLWVVLLFVNHQKISIFTAKISQMFS